MHKTALPAQNIMKRLCETRVRACVCVCPCDIVTLMTMACRGQQAVHYLESVHLSGF